MEPERGENSEGSSGKGALVALGKAEARLRGVKDTFNGLS